MGKGSFELQFSFLVDLSCDVSLNDRCYDNVDPTLPWRWSSGHFPSAWRFLPAPQKHRALCRPSPPITAMWPRIPVCYIHFFRIWTGSRLRICLIDKHFPWKIVETSGARRCDYSLYSRQLSDVLIPFLSRLLRESRSPLFRIRWSNSEFSSFSIYSSRVIETIGWKDENITFILYDLGWNKTN